MGSDRPRRKSGGSYHAPPKLGRRGVSTLSGLFDHWRNSPGSFGREAPPPKPPLPLKFTCRGCGGDVKVHSDEGYGTCRGCGGTYGF